MADYAGPILSVVGIVTGNPWIQVAAFAVNAYGGGTADPSKLPTIQPQQDQEHIDERA